MGKITNEKRVEQIRNGFSVTVNMERLYTDNLPLIRKFVRPYVNYCPEEDLMQEAYFGLYEAVGHYETSENVLFMTYAQYWIRSQVQRYIEDCGSVIRVPSNYRHKINRYKKKVQEYQQVHGRTPTDNELSALMNMPVSKVRKIQPYLADVQSIDEPLPDSDGFTLGDTLQADFSVESDVVDNLYAEHAKSELWGIVEHHTDIRQQEVIKQYFCEGKTVAEIARESGQTFQEVRTQKENGLRKLRTGRAAREIKEKLEVVEAGIYRNNINKFKEHGSSTVEYIAVRRAELQAEYEERKKQIELLLEQRKRTC